MLRRLVLLVVIAASFIHAQQPVTINVDAKVGVEKIIEINAYYKGKNQFLTKIKTDGRESFTISDFKTPGLYTISIKGFNNPAEFIYNPEEDIRLFVGPELSNGSLGIENSPENKAYSDLIKINTAYGRYLDSLQQLRRTLPTTTPDFYGKCFFLDSLYEAVALEKNGRLTYIQFAYPNSFTSKVLVPVNLVPVASLEERRKFQTPDAYLSAFYFKYIKVNEQLFYHYGIENAVIDYLAKYSEPHTEGIKKSIVYVMETFKKDTAVASYVSEFLIKTFLDAKKPELALYVMGNAGEGCSFDLGEKQNEYLSNYTHVQIGSQVDDIVLNDVNGIPVSLSNTCKKTEVNILIFWTSWCVHCKKVLPELKDLLKTYRGKVNVFAVSLDDNKEEWAGFINKNDLGEWVNVSELKPIQKSTLAPRFMVTHTPTVYLLNKERKILAKNLNKDQIISELQLRVK